MNLRLAIVTDAGPAGCTVRWLDEPGERAARYAPTMHPRVRIVPRQLVAVDTGADQPAVVWRWLRGVVILRRGDHVVVDNHVFQPGFRIPISVARIPEELELDVPLGAEVFYSHEPNGAVVDVAAGDLPAHPARLAADMLPAVAEVYAEMRGREGV